MWIYIEHKNGLFKSNVTSFVSSPLHHKQVYNLYAIGFYSLQHLAKHLSTLQE